MRAKNVYNTYLQCLSCYASFSYKSTKLRFQQQSLQQLIQTLHQQQYLWHLQYGINFKAWRETQQRFIFTQKKKCWLPWNMKTRLKNVIHNNYLYETQQAAMHNYVLTQRKIRDTNSAHARLKEIPDNIYTKYSPLFRSF